MLQERFHSRSATNARSARTLSVLTLALLGLLVSGCGGGGAGESVNGGSGGEDDGGDTGDDGGDDGGDAGGGGGDTAFDDYAIQYGMNTARGGYAYRTVTFADVMMRGSEFSEFDGAFVNLTLPVPVIPFGQGRVGEGWPDLAAAAQGTIAGSRIFSAMEGTIPDGRTTPYVVEWTGTGNCRLQGSGVGGEMNRSANRFEVFIDPTIVNGVDPVVSLLIDASMANDPVRDVRIWLPGMESTKPLFWQPFLDKLMDMNDGNGPYIWRTTNWASVYNYGLTDGANGFVFDFDSRVTTRYPSQRTKKGMCVEMMVAFSNAIGRDLILSIPHRTDQMTEAEYAVYLADLYDRVANGSPAVPGINGGQAFSGLDSGLKVWLELSNEIWNPAYNVHGWMNTQAALKGITFEQQVGGEISTMVQAALPAFSGSGDDRLRLYVGGHIINPDSLEGILDALPAGTQVDGIGPAFYFSEQNTDISGWLNGADSGTGACPNCPTAVEIIDAARASIPILGTFLREHRAVADGYINPDGSSPLLMLYEGGQHFVAGNFPWYEEVNAAQLLPEMYSAYVDDLIPTLVQEGVDVMCWFSFMSDQDPTPVGGLGPFGIWNTMDQQITMPVPDIYIDEQAPKAAAIYLGPPLLP